MINTYSKAYTEVFEIIKYLPKEEYNKIPKDKIEFYKENMDINYKFHINPSIDLEKQNISKEANAILITIFRDYFATDKQKESLKRLLSQNQQKLEQQKSQKYDSIELFNKPLMNKQNAKELQENFNETRLVEVKENYFVRFINFIKKIFKGY